MGRFLEGISNSEDVCSFGTIELTACTTGISFGHGQDGKVEIYDIFSGNKMQLGLSPKVMKKALGLFAYTVSAELFDSRKSFALCKVSELPALDAPFR